MKARAPSASAAAAAPASAWMRTREKSYWKRDSKRDRSAGTNGSPLVDVVAAELNALMQRVHRSEAEGRWVVSKTEEERPLVREFAEYFVNELFLGALKGDAARLAGTQLNLLRDTCDTLYREMDDRERAEKRAAETDSTNNTTIEE